MATTFTVEEVQAMARAVARLFERWKSMTQRPPRCSG